MSVTNANEFESALHDSSKSGGLSATFQKIFQAMVNARMNEARVQIVQVLRQRSDHQRRPCRRGRKCEVQIVQVLRQRSDTELTAMGYTSDDIANIRAGRFVTISS